MAFTGVATYEIFDAEIGEDVSSMVADISPRTAPFLNWAGDAGTSIGNPYYTWEEKSLLPETFDTSSAIASSAAASYGVEVGANANLLRVGDILRIGFSGEQMRVNSIGTGAASIYVERAYAGTSGNSSAAGEDLIFIGSALEEGTDPREERRVNHVLKSNFVQKFREDIKVSRRANQATLKVPGFPAPFDEDVADKTVEVVKQLERAVLMGRTNGNTIGASGEETTMAGIYHSVVTNVVSSATWTNSLMNNLLATMDTQTDVTGNSDRYSIWAGTRAYRSISNSRDSRVEQGVQEVEAGIKAPTMYLSDFGDIPMFKSRYLPQGSILVLRRDFIEIAPYNGLSFATRRYDNGSSSETGYVEGTYGLRFMQEAGQGVFKGIGGND